MRGPLRRIASLLTAAIAAVVLLGTGLVLSGHNALVTTHGVSMNPVYYQGDLVVVQRSDSYRVGEIVAYRRPDIGLVVLHRIIGGDPSGFVFKGDNNQSVDPTRPAQAQLIGRAVLHIPGGGLWLHRLISPPLVAAFAFLLLVGGGRVAVNTRRQRRKDTRTMPPRHRAKPCRSLGSLPPGLQPVAVGAAVVAVAGLALSALAWTRPALQSVPTKIRDASTMSFSYTAHVPRSAAYDGTTVTAPQPVFRRLTNTVDVSYQYAGRPGRLTVSAELTTANGWFSRIPLAQAVVGPAYRGAVRLDLQALERRAADAAKATGLPASQVQVAIVPAVRRDGGGSFEPRLDLLLDPLTLKSAGSLVATSSTATTGVREQPARLALLGHSIGVAAARVAGGLALGLCLLTGLVLAGVARMTGPVAEAERIRAQYRDLILPVLPIALSPGRPVVDVPDVASLARLAERYGLLVLHWSRGGINTYVVQDEGTTYRCRLGARDASIPSAELEHV